MTRLSLNEMTTFRWSFDEDVINYAAGGWKAIGVWRQKLADFGEEKGIELLADHGLEVSNLMWAGGFTGSDGRPLRDSLEDAAAAIRLAADLQAGCLVVYTGARAGHTHKHARRLVRDALKQLLPVAEEHGVTLAIEPMHAECAAGWTFLTTLDDTLALLDLLDHPRLQLALDSYHLGFDPGLIERIPELAARTAVVHIGDGHAPTDREQDRCLLGEGEVPLREILLALRNAGYDGAYDVELVGPEIEWIDNHDLVSASKRACEQLFDFAAVSGSR